MPRIPIKRSALQPVPFWDGPYELSQRYVHPQNPDRIVWVNADEARDYVASAPAEDTIAAALSLELERFDEGRCPECHTHIDTQGHAWSCNAKK
jgi:hypothetical protein